MNVIEAMREATSEQVMTIGRLYMNVPESPLSDRNGRYATMLVMVANMIAFASLVGPHHAATTLGCPAARSRLIASPATTGSSTSRPKAMISEAIETCW